MVFRDGVGRATVIRSNPRGFREDADVLSRSGAREQDARGGVLVRFEGRDAEMTGRDRRSRGIVGVVGDDGRAGNAPARRGTCSRAGAP